MTTKTTTPIALDPQDLIAVVVTATAYELEQAYREAVENATEAWDAQSKMTVDELVTDRSTQEEIQKAYEMAALAIEQAKAADYVAGLAYTRWQRALAAEQMALAYEFSDRAILDDFPADTEGEPDADVTRSEYLAMVGL